MKFLIYLFIAISYLFLGLPDATANSGDPDNPLPWAAMRTFPQFAVPEFKSAYAYTPDGTLHPLRPLGMANACNNWQSYSHDGVGKYGEPDPALEQSVCGLIDILPGTYQDSFMVFDYGSYPPLTFIDRGKAHETLFDCMVSQVENQFNPPFYLLIGKQINPENASVEFKVRLKLPGHNEFAGVNATLQSGFESTVLNAITEHHGGSGDLTQLISDEIAGINKLKELLQSFLSGGFNGGLTASLLELNEFQELPLGVGQSQIFKATHGPKSTDGPIKDYCRRKVFIDLAEEYIYLSELASYGLTAFTGATGASAAIILTDNSDYAPGTNNDFQSASDDYDNLSEDLIVWAHYIENIDTNQSGQLFIKYKVNLDESAIENLLQNIYESEVNGTPITPFTGEGGEEKKSPNEKSLNCSNVPCGFSYNLKWRAYCCLLPNVSNLDLFPYNTLPYGLSMQVVQGSVEYYAGVSCGTLDGFIELIAFAATVTEVVGTALKNTPGTVPWFSELLTKTLKKGSFKKALKIKLEEDKNYWFGVYSKALMFFDLLSTLDMDTIRQIFYNIWAELKAWAGDMVGQNGTSEAGYAMGKVVFEIVLDFLTGGTGKAVKLGKNLFKQFIDLIDGTGDGIRHVMHSAWNSGKAKASTKIFCKIAIGGCFVKGTTVLMAGNTIGRSGKNYALAALPFVGVPVDDAPLLGWALAHKTVNAPYNGTASKDDDPYMGLMNGDPYTSEQQKQRDRYELNDTGWYAVEFEQINGSSKCHLALHDHWIQSHGYAIDGVVNMNLPEQGISGPFKITAVQHVIPQKKPIDEDPDDEWEYRPVTGLFEHQSDDVWRIRFASGVELGVTSNHPIYSNSRRGWIPAGDLEIGEEVLSLRGAEKVSSKERDDTAQTVHNLEVRELHNFLVGRDGVVVHNNYGILQTLIDGIHNATKAFHKPFKCAEYSKALRTYFKNNDVNIKTKRWQLTLNGENYPSVIGFDMPNGTTIQISNNGFHEFTIINDKIFDNNVFDGMPISEFMERIVIPPGIGVKEFDIFN